jgi:hypothetical protein
MRGDGGSAGRVRGPAARAVRVADPVSTRSADHVMMFGRGPADAYPAPAEPVDLGTFIADLKKRMKNMVGGVRWRRVR